MIQAIEEMQKCPEHPHKPKVGCIIVRDNATIATGYKGMTKDGSHAEREALDFLEEHSISAAGGTIYTTMEPCIQTNAQCSEKIYEHGINEVVFGSFDVNPKIRGRGYSYLKSKGIAQRGFDEDLHREIDEINSQFMDNFQRSTGPENHCNFPYKENQNKRRLELIFSKDDDRKIILKCSSRDDNSVYLYADRPAAVARSHEHCAFDELDSSLLALYDFDYSAEIESDEIAVFKSPDGFALVKVSRIDRDNPVVHIEFQIRAFDEINS